MAKYGDFVFLDVDDFDDKRSHGNDIPLEERGGDDGFNIPSEEDGGNLGSAGVLEDWGKALEAVAGKGEQEEREVEVRATKSQVGRKVGKKKKGRPKRGSRGKYNKGDKHKTDFSAGLTWNSIVRNRWRNGVIQARKKGLDFLPYDVYQALWNAAGVVTTDWGEQCEAFKLQTKFYDTRTRTLLIRLATTQVEGKKWIENPSKGFERGNVAIVKVKGYFRNHTKPDIEPEVYQVLATWESDGTITDRMGNAVSSDQTTVHR